MWGKPLTVTNYPFSHNHGSVEKSPENERKRILEIHPFSTGCHDYMGGYGDILSWELISIIPWKKNHFEDDDVPNFPVVAELLVDRVGDAHHLIFWPVSDFFWGGWKKLPKGRGGEAVGELFFFLYRHFWDEFFVELYVFFSFKSCWMSCFHGCDDGIDMSSYAWFSSKLFHIFGWNHASINSAKMSLDAEIPCFDHVNHQVTWRIVRNNRSY